MTRGSGTSGKTDLPPEDAIEEISGLLEMDELEAGESQADSSEAVQAGVARTSEDIPAIDVSLETPGPLNLDSYLPPPPVGEEPPSGEVSEVKSGLATNLAYEDLLEKLVLPAKSAAPEEPAASGETPPLESIRPNSTESASADLFPPNPITSEERTVVTANPLLAEEQEAAARVAEDFILPPAPAAPPSFAATPVVAPVLSEPIPRLGLRAPSKVIQISYPMLGIMMLAAVLVGAVLSRLMAPTRVVVTAAPAQTPILVDHPVVPVRATQPVNPAPQVVPLPTPTETPAEAAAKPAVTAEGDQPGAVGAAEPAAEFEEPPPAAKPRAHHAAKAPRPPRSVAAKADPSKPAAPKKAGKIWVDPFAQ